MPDGASLADHKASADRQWEKLGAKKKHKVETQDGPQCPSELFYLWRFFHELSEGISSGGFGPAIITWTDLYSWRVQMGIDLAPWEARALVQLGTMRAIVASEKQPGQA